MAGTDWGSLIGAGMSMYGASKSAKTAKGAGKDATKAAGQATDLQKYIYDDQRSLNMPAMQAGNAARDRFAQLMGLGSFPGTGNASNAGSSGAMPTNWFGNGKGTPAVNQQLYDADPRYKQAWDSVSANHQQNFGRGYSKDSDRNKLQAHMQQLYSASAPQNTQSAGMSQQQAFDAFRNTPGYQFRMDEGRKQLDASASARGSLNSGATLKALTQYGQGVADQGYTGYMNGLSGLFGGAQQAVSNIGGAGQNYASQAGNNLMGAARARQQSTYAANDAWQQGAGDAYGMLNRWYQGRQGGGG